MRKIASLAAAILAACLLVAVGPATPTQASPGAYAYVQHISKGWLGQRISVKCHTNGTWHALYDGNHSDQACGSNGWVDALDVGSCRFLTVRNISTGQVIQYGNNYHGYGPPGGYWDAWVTQTPGC
jgi:hypothetical protein